MKLIVESGATKSTWVLLNKKEIVDTQVLAGINPTSNPSSVNLITAYKLPEGVKLTGLSFYGAGVSSPVAIRLLEDTLKDKFGQVQINLGHDILAAALAISSGQRSIVSILGTGTNTVVFDGEKIQHSFKALGYLYGDYGSAFHIGKEIIRHYFTKQMSEEDDILFHTDYILGRDDLLFTIYNSEKPNFETAKLSYFLSKCSAELREKILDIVFSAFFRNQIDPIIDSKTYKLNFVGSISSVFEKELRSKATSLGYDIDKINGNPINGLIAHYCKEENN